MSEEYADTNPPRKGKSRTKLRETAVAEPRKPRRMPKTGKNDGEGYDPAPIRASIDSHLRSRRKAVRTFEREAGIKDGRLRKAISGEIESPGIDVFIKAARQLGITVSELIGESSAPPPLAEQIEVAVAERMKSAPSADAGLIVELEARVGALTVEAARWKQAGVQAREEVQALRAQLAETERMLESVQAKRRPRLS